jgi:hypothetical protein
MRSLSTFALLSLLPFSSAVAQNYCEPTFVNGCFSWQNQVIAIGTIDWTSIDCTISDYTDMVTDITPGVPTAMTVTNGNWCGCAVWVDLDQSSSFDTTEVLFTQYGGSEVHDYDFDITIPANTPPGLYRMRVIAPWGSDGVSPGANGYGACGAYQYGNFDDFTLNVTGPESIAEAHASPVAVGPNPTEGLITIDTKAIGAVQRLIVWSADGRRMMERSIASNAGQVQADLSGLPSGLYTLQFVATNATYTAQVVKR